MKNLNVSITEPQYERLIQLQQETQLSKSDHVRRALDLYFRQFSWQSQKQEEQEKKRE